MKIVLRCWDSHDGACGCDYAFVDISPKRARFLLKRHAAFLKFRKANDAREASWWSDDVDYFTLLGDGLDSDHPVTPEETERMEQALSALDDGGDLVEVPDDFEVPDVMLTRTECNMMIVTEAGVLFSGIPKHTDVPITTGMIPVEVIERVAAVTMKKKGKK